MSKYAELRDHLLSTKNDRWVASFDEIENVLGFRLPQSARKYPAWWANQSTPGHSQCAGWLDAGWRTSDLDLTEQRVTFVKFNAPEEQVPLYKPSKAMLDWADVLEERLDAMQLRLELNWHRLGSLALDTRDMIVFPRTPVRPAVYRYRISSKDERSSYFGETDEISRRFQHYRTPGPTQRTNQWLNGHMKDCLRHGGCVDIDVLRDGNLFYGDRCCEADLSCKFTRRLLENAAITLEKRSGRTVLNK